MHSTMRTANSIHYMCVISNCQTGERDTAACQVKRWEGMEGKREEKRRRDNTEETADISDICSWFSLHVRFFFFSSLSHHDGKREGGGGGDKSAYQNERLQQFLHNSYCNHFSPSPVCVPGCVDTVKRRDASCCMTNQDELIHLSMVSFLNKPMGSVCISPIQWLSNSLQQNLSLFASHVALLSSFETHWLSHSSSSPPTPYLFLPSLSFPHYHSICCVLLRVTLSVCMILCLPIWRSLYLRSQATFPVFPSYKLSLYLNQVSLCSPCPTFLTRVF